MKDNKGIEINVGDTIHVGKKHRFYSKPSREITGIVKAVDVHPPLEITPCILVQDLNTSYSEPEYVEP